MKYDYTLFDIYQKTFRQGGPTLKQLYGLYSLGQDYEYTQIKINAAFHGVDLKGGKDTKQDSTEQAQQTGETMDGSLPFFRSLEEFEHLSKEERKKLTEEMMGKHRQWAGKSALNKAQNRGLAKDGK